MSDEKPNASPVAGVLVGHGVFLAACGIFGASSNGWAPSAMHSAYAGIGSCVVLTGCGILSLGSRKMYMIGVHIGLYLLYASTGEGSQIATSQLASSLTALTNGLKT